MLNEDNSWLLNLKKGDTVWCATNYYGEINAFKTVTVSKINKDTISVVDKEGNHYGCYYKKSGYERVGGTWHTISNLLLNPNDEKHQKMRNDFIIRSKFNNLFYKISKMSKVSIKLEEMEEYSKVMETFLDSWDKILHKEVSKN